MSEIEGNNPYAWLIERKIFEKDKKETEKNRIIRKKEEKKLAKEARIASTLSLTDKHILQRLVYGSPYPGDSDNYKRLREAGYIAKADLAGQEIYGLTQQGADAIYD